MKIKEAERLTGIPAANIRYYEKEGLIHPERDKENHYREYQMSDIEKLEQIKILRLLGITLEEIKRLFQEEDTLENAMEQRLLQVKKDEVHLQEIRRVCEYILQNRIGIESLNETVLDEKQEIWKERLKKVLSEDMSRTMLSRRQFHLHIGIMLIWGYLLSLGMTLWTRSFFYASRTELWMKLWSKSYTMPGETIGGGGMELFFFFASVCVMIGCGIAVWWSSRIVVQIVVYHISALMGAPVLMMVTSFFAGDLLQQDICRFLPVLFGILICYVLILLMIERVWKEFFARTRNLVWAAFLISFLIAGIGWLMLDRFWVSAILALAFTLDMGVLWSAADIDAKGDYTRYRAVLSVERILNPVALTFSYWGRSKTPLWVDWN